MTIDSISQLSGMLPDIKSGGITGNSVNGGSDLGQKSFVSHLKDSISQVNELVDQADKASLNLAAGKAENLHDAMIAMEKAESAFKLLVQVRNKVIDAYNEIIRMQV